MDVRGTFERLGFVWHYQKGVEYAIAHVQLFHPMEAQFVRRAISHVCFVVALEGEERRRLGVQMRYGYPVDIHRGAKVVHSFKDLTTSDSTYWEFPDDRTLREIEALFRDLFKHLRTKTIDCTAFDQDRHRRVVPGYDALRAAVRQGLSSKTRWQRSQDVGDWWLDEVKQEEPCPVVPANKYSRLPNFDKSTRPRHRRGYSHRRGC